ncbi:hypothetical protein LCO01nite_03280 [Lapidilactobacillus concavus]|nr:hypothetical protein LCO01nite_03280 [Lapidilactobacillus concavus]
MIIDKIMACPLSIVNKPSLTSSIEFAIKLETYFSGKMGKKRKVTLKSLTFRSHASIITLLLNLMALNLVN